VSSHELDWQERKAESFVLSPLYCGSQTTGYQMLPDDFHRGNLTLGQAMAISGAAADPNMGYHQSTPVTALMTVFNTRLGWWIENPARPLTKREDPGASRWAAESPSFGGLILKELLGQTDADGYWIHLSDGGHFENLGAYELIRRRCRYIVISDAGADPGFAFEDLANLIRKCRVDFGIRIEIDTGPIHRHSPDNLSRWHCAVGKIHYEDVDGGSEPGLLVYVKASLNGDESPDLQEYARRDRSFPHQTTADQFFDETQFESYRALGLHVALTVFSEPAEEMKGVPDQDLIEWNRLFYNKLQDRWYHGPPDLEEHSQAIADAFDRLQESMRRDHNLRALTYELYPELGDVPGPDSLEVNPVDRNCAELHAVTQIVILMEKAWFVAKLKGYPEHPMNRGWMNQFKRFARSKIFNKYWPAVRNTFSEDFLRFCEQELGLDIRKILMPHPSWSDGEREERETLGCHDGGI
jgi:hypothetical protein